MDTNALRTKVSDDMPRTIDELSRLVAIPSIGYPGYDPAHVRASAELDRATSSPPRAPPAPA